MVSILFDADLSAVIVQRAIFWIVLNKELGFGAFVATAPPGRWSVGVRCDPSRERLEDFDQTRCEGVIRYRKGRVYLAIP